MSVDYAAIKQMSKAMWGLGDYTPLSKLLEPAATDLAKACGVVDGQDALDVAAGNGNCALALARLGARVVASDLTPALMEVGAKRAKEERLGIEWVEADVEDLPFEGNRFHLVTSVFGAMLAPRPEVAVSEMFRVAAPLATVAMANWTSDGFQKQMMDVVEKYSPPRRSEVPSPFLWGDEDVVRSRLERLAKSVEIEKRELTWEFESFEQIRAVFESHGGAVMAKRALPVEVYEVQAKDLQALIETFNERTDGRIRITSDYLRVIARKA